MFVSNFIAVGFVGISRTEVFTAPVLAAHDVQDQPKRGMSYGSRILKPENDYKTETLAGGGHGMRG